MGGKERLNKARRELHDLRRKGGVTARDLIRLAQRMGHQETNRGKEPTWEHADPRLFPITIPGHSGDLAKGTANGIIDRLLSDIDVLLPEEEES